MRQKFVVRLLDSDGALLAWATVWAVARPQRPGGQGASCPFWPEAATLLPIERAGVGSRLTVHWCDLDVAREAPVLMPTQVEPGQVMAFQWIEPVWLVPGTRDVPLPAVTERGPVAVQVPSGTLVGRADGSVVPA